jgi:glycosyltransferase involved in cell wall biosynthesis
MKEETSYQPVEFNILKLNYEITKQTVLVLLSTFNRMESIIESIKSIVNQTYDDVLLHIIDDNSTDDVIGLITNYINENKTTNIILSKKNINSGPYINFNYILDYHKNDDFGFWVLQGSDDVSDKKRISNLITFFDKNPKFNSCRSKYTIDVESPTPKYGDSMLMNRKSVFNDIGYYDNNRFGGDSDYATRVLLKYGRLGNIPETLYYAKPGENRLTKKYDKTIREEYVKIITKEHLKSLYRDFILVNRDSIVCGVATIQSRKNGLKECVNSIINQVDKLIVYQNGYHEIFDFLKNPKIEVISSLTTGIDMGDAGKFYKVGEYKNCYYFSMDDDLVYPSNYITNTLSNLNKNGKQFIVTYHGRILKPTALSYYNDSLKLNHCLKDQENDEFIQFGGTGVMAFHTDIVNIDFKYFKKPNMADVWVGKYAQDNNIPILSLKHNKGWIKETTYKDEFTIYNTHSKKDLGQDEIIQGYDKKKILTTNINFSVGERLLNPVLSVIIPTYKHPEFLDECLTSVIKSIKNRECEILVGIDSCQETLDFIKNKTFDSRIKFFYFPKNIGPYIIKNSLSKLSNSNYLLFFDSDDIMKENMIDIILSEQNKCDFVKPKYLNFKHSEGYQKYINENRSNTYGEGVFSIKKELFLLMNGFESWRTSADTDFMTRLYKNSRKLINTKDILFFRRIHNDSLTQSKNTGLGSKLRGEYNKLIFNRTSFGPLPKLVTEFFIGVNVNTIVYPKFKEVVKDETTLNREKTLMVVNDVLSRKQNTTTKVDYDKINEVIKKQNTYNINSSQKPVRENKPTDRSKIIELKKDSLSQLNRQFSKGKQKNNTNTPNIFSGNNKRGGRLSN